MPAAQRRQLFYSGRVQGVGFRYTTYSIARGYDVAGYVQNLSDGRVELVAEGDPEELDLFLAEVADRLGGYIRDQRCDSRPALGEFASFEIRR